MKYTVERLHSGIQISTVYKGYHRHKLYIGYSLKEAKEAFREYLKKLDETIIEEIRQ